MKAALFWGIGRGLDVVERSVPIPGPGEVLVRVLAAGLCGSDVHIAVEGITPVARLPIVLGHEAAGVVERVGPEVSRWQAGMRVAVLPDVACGWCVNCVDGRSDLCLSRELLGIHRDGALAQYLVAPDRNLVHLPDSVSEEVGAIATDAVATPYHALVRVAGLHGGERVLLLGMGALGLHAVMLARALGAGRVAAVSAHRMGLVRAWVRGADDVWALDQTEQWTAGRYDVVLDFTGNPDVVERAAEALRPGGRLVLVGLSDKPLRLGSVAALVRRGITVAGSYGAHAGDVVEVLRLADTGRIDWSASVTHRFGLEDAQWALAHLHRKLGDPIRIVVLPQLAASRPSALCRTTAAWS
jgi:2-desacetyl-2-hydroxyethyl bacteriochlorophyllide A dehydrogenase